VAVAEDAGRTLFSGIAGAYDALNRTMTLGLDVVWRWRAMRTAERCIARAGGDAGRILDIASGTADFAIAAARRFPEAHVLGVDVTPEMLDVGRRKVGRLGLSARVELETGDAERLELADGSFDCALCAFGFRNFPDRRRALGEARRVLRPGGHLLVLEFFRIETRAFAWFTSAWLRFTTALAARGAEDEYAYLRTSIDRMASARTFIDEAGTVGFECVADAFYVPACRCICFSRR
jgi:demethylmenaquinone methyltransferase/2-methoxy-6-polyprenyl-1,4-benzoquinol methylase